MMYRHGALRYLRRVKMLTNYRASLEAAMEFEKMLTGGRALGLSDEQTRQVFRAWQTHYRATPYPLNWRQVNRALIARAVGDEWQPPS